MCDLCAKTFASQETLKRQTVHRQLGGFSCRFYRREHPKKRDIRKHVNKECEAPASYPCPVCQGSFHYRGHLREHLKSHPATISSSSTSAASPLPPAASGLRPDARTCPAKLPASVPEDCCQCYRDNWSQIRSRQRGGKCVLVHTQRLEAASDIGNTLRAIFRAQRNAFKINLVFGFILSNVETGEKQYYYPSQNGLIFDHPLVVLQRVGGTDWLEYVRQQKPNNKWHIALLTNVTFHLYPMENRPVGRNKITGQLPKWLVENQGLDALEKDRRTGQLYADHFCYFRCLARYRGCGLKNLERKTRELASTYLATLEQPESFAGMRLRDLHALAPLLWRRAATGQVLACGRQVVGLGGSRSHPVLHPTRSGREAPRSGPGNCQWMATMLPARPPTSFTVVAGTVTDVG